MKSIFASEIQPEARKRFCQLVDELDGKAEKVIDTLSVMDLPMKYRRHLAKPIGRYGLLIHS